MWTIKTKAAKGAPKILNSVEKFGRAVNDFADTGSKPGFKKLENEFAKLCDQLSTEADERKALKWVWAHIRNHAVRCVNTKDTSQQETEIAGLQDYANVFLGMAFCLCNHRRP